MDLHQHLQSIYPDLMSNWHTRFVKVSFGWQLVILILLVIFLGWTADNIAWADEPSVTFEDVTASAGMEAVDSNMGAAWADYDGDGLEDIYVGHHGHLPALYRNNGDGTFSDMANQAGMSDIHDRHGVSWGDYNNDGWPDLYITAGRASGGSQFYVNNGDGTFSDQASQANILNYWGSGRLARWADYDNDGHLDLYVVNAPVSTFNTLPNQLYHNNGDGTFSDVSAESGLDLGSGTGALSWGDYDGDGFVDILMGDTLALYKNNGDGTFSNVTEAASIQPHGASHKFDWGDYDNDGDFDFYVGRGYWGFGDTLTIVDSNTIEFTGRDEDGLSFVNSGGTQITVSLWHSDYDMDKKNVFIGSSGYNPASSHFTLDDSPQNYGMPSYTPGVSYGVYIWKDSTSGEWHIHWSNTLVVGIVTGDGSLTQVSKIDFEDYVSEYPRKNYLYRNNGDGTFTDVSDVAVVGSGPILNTVGVSWIDFDNDGDLDLYEANQGDVAVGNHPNRLYRNNGDGTFTDVAQDVGLQALTPGYGGCDAWADYDQDGFMDVFLTSNSWVGILDHLAGPQKLYRNRGNGNNWLRISLVGVQSNLQGLGAKVELQTSTGLQYREASIHSGSACQDSSILHFGLGTLDNIDQLTITWPSGTIDTFSNLSVNQHITITEGTSHIPGQGNKIYLPIILSQQ